MEIYKLIILKVNNWFWNFICLLIIILYFALPSINISELENPTQSGKFFIFSCISLFIFALYSIRFFLQSRLIRINLLDVLFLVLLLYININRYLLQDHQAFSISYYELGGLSCLYIILRDIKKSTIGLLFLAITLGGICQAIYGYLQLLNYCDSNHSGFNITGNFFNPGPYAGYLAGIMPISIGIFLFRDQFSEELIFNSHRKLRQIGHYKKFVKTSVSVVSVIASILLLLVIGITQSRGAWLGLIFSCIFLAYKYFHNFKVQFITNRFTRRAIVVLTYLCFGLFFIALYFLKQKSADGRMLIWRITLNIINDHKWIGTGFDGFMSAYMNYQHDFFRNHISGEVSRVADNTMYAFNEPLQAVSEIGLVGGTILLFICLIILRIKFTKECYIEVICGASILSIFIFSLFSYPSQFIEIKINTLLCLAILAKTYKPFININISLTNRSISIAKYFLIGLFFFIATFLWGALKNCYNAYKNWNTASYAYQTDDYSESLIYYKKAYPVLYRNGIFMMQYGKCLSTTGNYVQAIEILKKIQPYYNNSVIQLSLGVSFMGLKQFSNAEKAFISASFMTPDKFYPQYLLAKLYCEMNQRNKAIVIATRLLQKQPKTKSLAVREIQTEMQKIIYSK